MVSFGRNSSGSSFFSRRKMEEDTHKDICEKCNEISADIQNNGMESVRQQFAANRMQHLKEALSAERSKPTWGGPKHESIRDASKGFGEAKRAIARFRGKEWKEDSVHQQAAAATKGDDWLASQLEESRQYYRYRWLYMLTAIVAAVIAIGAVGVDYMILWNDVFGQTLKDGFGRYNYTSAEAWSVAVKSGQVLFAAIALHFLLKVTGGIGRVLLIVVTAGLAGWMLTHTGTIIADQNHASLSKHLPTMSGSYNNVPGTTPRLSDQIDLHSSYSNGSPSPFVAGIQGQSVYATNGFLAQQPQQLAVYPSAYLGEQTINGAAEYMRSKPQESFAAIFIIVATVAALFIGIAENNVRNWKRAQDYKNRRNQYVELQALKLLSDPD